jgi:secondary thiamine-phosphate synthase enzyme
VQTIDYCRHPNEVNPFGLLSLRFWPIKPEGWRSDRGPVAEAIKQKTNNVPNSRVSGVCDSEERKMIWIQEELMLPRYRRGFHLITPTVLTAVPAIQRIRLGLLHLFLQHTSASLTLNENADPDVQLDLEMATARIVPEALPYVHTLEGRDDMPAHVKCSLLGSSLTIPLANGRPRLGIWQGIYLCEHRNQATARHLVVTAFGQGSDEAAAPGP